MPEELHACKHLSPEKFHDCDRSAYIEQLAWLQSSQIPSSKGLHLANPCALSLLTMARMSDLAHQCGNPGKYYKQLVLEQSTCLRMLVMR